MITKRKLAIEIILDARRPEAMIEASSLPPTEPVYTFIDASGTNTTIAAARLRRHCMGLDAGPVAKPKFRYPTHLFPVEARLARKFIEQNVVSQTRMIELLTKEALDPIIACADGHFTEGRPDVMLVDGHHRYALAAAMRLDAIPAFILQPDQWKPFQVIGCVPMTQDQLRELPITTRRY